jgi:hypothetical protein
MASITTPRTLPKAWERAGPRRLLQIALGSRVRSDRFFELCIARHWGEEPNVVLEGSKVYEDAVQPKRGHPVTDDLVRVRRGGSDGLPYLPKDRLYLRPRVCNILVNARW